MLDGFNQFSAYNYDPKSVKVEIPVFENISFYDPSTLGATRWGPTRFLTQNMKYYTILDPFKFYKHPYVSFLVPIKVGS